MDLSLFGDFEEDFSDFGDLLLLLSGGFEGFTFSYNLALFRLWRLTTLAVWKF